MKKKAQAAMEFLMTYGWAILVVLAAIAALAYFGVLAPEKFLPEKCTMVPGLACLDFKVTSDGANLLISNSLGKDIDVTRVTIGNCSQDFTLQLKNGEQHQFDLAVCSNGASGQSFKEDIEFHYTVSDTGFSKISIGQISTKIQ